MKTKPYKPGLGMIVIALVLIFAGLSCALIPTATPQSSPTTQPVQVNETQLPTDDTQPTQNVPPSAAPSEAPPATQVQVPTTAPTTPPTTPPTLPSPAFTLQRLTAIVKAGPVAPLQKVETDQEQPFPDGNIVTVNTDGEALIKGNLEGKVCKIFVFFDTRLQKKSCDKSAFNGGNVSCVQDGSAIFNNCSNMLVQTPAAEFQLTGTWVEVTHVRNQQFSNILVSEGQVVARPVTNLETYSLGPEVMVTPKQFLFTGPDANLPQVAGMEARTAISWDQFPAVMQQYSLERWYQHGASIAGQSNVPFPNLGQTTPQADLITSLQARDITASDIQLINNNPNSIGVPVRMVVTNQGDQAAPIFKVSIDGKAQDGDFVRPFTVPGQQDTYYPHTTQELGPGERVAFDGLVFFPSNLDGSAATLVGTADSCSGEESTPDYCKVQESDESNNASTPHDAKIAVHYAVP